MLQQLIDLSPDLRQLRNEGYDIQILGGYLLVQNVPYVDSTRTTQHGVLILPLDLAGNATTKPSNHIAYWMGQHPCHADGSKLSEIENSSYSQDLGNGIHTDFKFSAKADYRDYYHKVTTYVGRITGEATKIDSEATAQLFPAILEDNGEGAFKYVDTASSRADIGKISEILAGQRIGIVGLGGTGAYILDFVAKTWVAEVHLFDGDVFSQHNAFRSPGAATFEQLQQHHQKVHYYTSVYSNMHNNIIPHEEFLCAANLDLLNGLDFVFICIDQGEVKHVIVNHLSSKEIAFVDVGMGVNLIDGQLGGIVRAVLSIPSNRDMAAQHISFDNGNSGNNEYTTNIQIAELNALNATLAIILWKKHHGIYQSVGGHYYAGYSIPSGEIAIEETE